MGKKEKRLNQVVELFNEYLDLRNSGMCHYEALAHFDYLHSITFSRLKKYIDTRLNDIEKKETGT